MTQPQPAVAAPALAPATAIPIGTTTCPTAAIAESHAGALSGWISETQYHDLHCNQHDTLLTFSTSKILF
jgi:hypothetical protein